MVYSSRDFFLFAALKFAFDYVGNINLFRVL